RYRNKPAVGIFAPWYPRPLTIWTRLDRVEKRSDGSLRIIDFKSGAREVTTPELLMDMGIRLQAAAGREIFGENVTHIAYVYLRTGNTVEISIEELELDLLRADVVEIVKKIQNGQFDPNLGPLCSVCEFQSDCEGWRSKIPWKPVKETKEKFSERLRLSYSKMSLFERCPRAYHKLYHERISPKPQPFFSFGSCIHAIMEDFYDPGSRERPTWERMLSIMDEQWRHFRVGYRNIEEEERYRQQGRHQLELFFNRFVKGQKFKPAYFIEKYFELPIGDDSIMTGFIDRIDKLSKGGYIVLDYKTEPTDRTQESVDKDLQLTLYYWASRDFLDLDIRQLGLFMMSHDKLTTTTRTPDAIPELMKRVIDVTKQIRSESEFAPQINKYCLSCDHLSGCPLEKEIRTDTAIRTMEFTSDDVENNDFSRSSGHGISR
ncbi:PD-(D/E)XK nuclease family protein, partial [bacterium]|nr:PD-(D/E)XK nuclease family protein [bacterium]